MLDWLKEAGVWLWDWLLGTLTAIGEAVWGGFLQVLPDVSGTSLAPWFDVLSVANQWLPIDAAVVLLGAFWTFSMSFTVVKMVLKLIPGIG